MKLTWTAMLVVVSVTAAVVTAGVSRQQRQASRCDPNETCSPLSTCSAFQKMLVNPSRAVLHRMRQAVCNRSRHNLKVCCPTTTSTLLDSLLPSHCTATRSGVALSRAQASVLPLFIYHGVDVKVGELPWMALLGYDSTTRPFWGCGGTLISDQYVLTAAHCIHPKYTEGSKLSVVRLGELNLKTVTDCDSTPTCASSPPQDFTPEKTILHPDFDNRALVSDDIALIRLNRKVTLNKYVKPLCLPPAGADVKEMLGDQDVLVSGWGKTETVEKSDIMQKAFLPFVNQATCNRTFDNKLLPEQICFGGRKQDSCRGDSGGPVTIQVHYGILQLGIVSRGKDRHCGVQGLPTLYTDVAAYKKWITEQLRS